MDFLVRIASLVKKELLAVLRDKKSRMALIIPPILQIAIFGYAATMNVTRVPYAVLDKDGGETAAQYIADLEGTGIFRRQAAAATEKDIDRMIDNREIVVGLTIPPDFSRNLQTGRPASLQLIADGRNTNTAAIGLCISSFAQSLQQAIVGTFLLLVPMVMLSGFATPISSMPEIFQ
ncbi:ABC transporter permease, partial [Akkermansia sp.]|uniref:ABC transporter permease n=1 Tax=Akkermansia sp. TaxID=1872421 RepID=UPI003AB1DD10